VLERNPTWEGQKPYFQRIVVKTIENTAALEANLLSGASTSAGRTRPLARPDAGLQKRFKANMTSSTNRR